MNPTRSTRSKTRVIQNVQPRSTAPTAAPRAPSPSSPVPRTYLEAARAPLGTPRRDYRRNSPPTPTSAAVSVTTDVSEAVVVDAAPLNDAPAAPQLLRALPNVATPEPVRSDDPEALDAANASHPDTKHPRANAWRNALASEHRLNVARAAQLASDNDVANQEDSQSRLRTTGGAAPTLRSDGKRPTRKRRRQASSSPQPAEGQDPPREATRVAALDDQDEPASTSEPSPTARRRACRKRQRCLTTARQVQEMGKATQTLGDEPELEPECPLPRAIPTRAPAPPPPTSPVA
ncbi:hypothetical protein GY45DRAFT_1376143 [Cubamyces sp. BRFM 1775]|nr:hypothetical protein GY45DRAFT_1376143 [Cubamyces sp. BRFM 1775]